MSGDMPLFASEGRGATKRATTPSRSVSPSLLAACNGDGARERWTKSPSANDRTRILLQPSVARPTPESFLSSAPLFDSRVWKLGLRFPQVDTCDVVKGDYAAKHTTKMTLDRSSNPVPKHAPAHALGQPSTRKRQLGESETACGK